MRVLLILVFFISLNKEKKFKNAIQTVKNIKKQLENLGVISREIIDGKSYAVVDLEWSKERYLQEFNEYFNDKQKPKDISQDDIKQEIENIKKLAEEGNISNESLAKKLEQLAQKIKTEEDDNKQTTENFIPPQDIDKTAEHIMNSEKIQKKIYEGKIKNEAAYKNAVKKQLKEGSFNGAKEYYNGLVSKEKEQILEDLTIYYQHNYPEKIYKNIKLYFAEIYFKNGLFISRYKNKNADFVKDFLIEKTDLQTAMGTFAQFTIKTQNIFIEYEKNKEELVKKQEVEKLDTS